MTQDQWQRVEAIFQEALDLAESERRAYLDSACAGDAQLRAEVDSLLAHECGDEGLAQVVSEAAASLDQAQSDSDVGLMLGPYHLAREIGRGGMGTVYLAVRTDDQYLHAVAVKLVRPGMYSPYLLSKFKHERQILATLQHPNIARLIDGGTTPDGRPYFVMEYIEGVPIVEFCEKDGPSIVRKLELFRKVCAAVQHAHQKLVIHRDIKPGNILVTAEGEPKLLDFGIAKLLIPELAPDGVQTTISIRMMTPEYGSPEQLRGEPVTTATDVYSLGIVLYELLTSRRPYALTGRTPSEVERLVCHQDPPRPSEAVEGDKPRRALRGDLDNIVMMAIRKEPERRYQTVEQFSDDLLRYLRAQPVAARKDTFFYRAGKFARRNRIALAAGTVAFASMVGGTAVSVWQARRAEERFEQVRQLAGSFLFDFHDELRALPGSTKLREKVVRTALQYLDSLAGGAERDASLARELSIAYERVGDAQGGRGNSNLGQTAAALSSYQKALALRERLVARHPEDLRLIRSLVTAYYKVGDLRWVVGDEAGALDYFRKGLAIGEKLYAADPNDREAASLLTGGYNRVGDREMTAHKLQQAIETWSKGLAVAKRQMDAGRGFERSYTLAEVRIAEALHKLGDLDKARNHFLNSLAIRRRLTEKNPDNQRGRRDLMVIYHHLANISGTPSSLNLGDIRAAEEYLAQAARICREFAAADPKNAEAQLDLSITTWKQGSVLMETNPLEALRLFHQALAITATLVKDSPETVPFRAQHANNLLGTAKAEFRLKLVPAAFTHIQQALEMLKHTRPDLDLVEALAVHAALLLAKGDELASRIEYERALQTIETLARDTPEDLVIRRSLAQLYEQMGVYYQNRRTPDCREAAMWYRKAAEIWQSWKQQGVETVKSRHLARVRDAASKCQGA